jgi:hypothetical protein
MNLKTTYILFGILAAALGVFLLTQLLHWRKPGTKSDYLFPEFHKQKDAVEANTIDKIEITHDGGKDEKFVFVRQDGAWRMESPGKYRIDDFAVGSVVTDVTGAPTEKSDASSDLHEYGLDSPRIKVVLSADDGDKKWTLNVGRELPGSDAVVYVTTGSDPKKPLVVKRSALASVFKSLGEFRSRDLLSAPQDSIQTIELQAGPEGKPLVLEKNSSNKWVFKKPAGFGAAAYRGQGPPALQGAIDQEITDVFGILQAIHSSKLRVEGENDFVADDVSAKDLNDKYGLNESKPETLRIEITSTGDKKAGDDSKPKTQVLLIGKKAPEEKADKKDDKDAKKDDKKDKAKDDKKPDPNKVEFYYARLANETSVVKVPWNKVKHLVEVAKKPDVLRDRNLADFDRSKLDAVRIENSNGNILLYRPAPLDPWKLWRGGSQDAEKFVVDDLLAALGPQTDGKGRVESFPTIKPSEAGMGEKDRLAVVSLWVGGLKKLDKKDAEPELKDPKKPTIRLTFGKKDEGKIYVLREVEGEKTPTLLLVKNTAADRAGGGNLADHVTAGPLAFIDRKIPSFSAMDTADITRFTIARGGEKYELKLEKAGDKSPTWKLEGPASLAGRQGDYLTIIRLLSSIQNLRAVRVEADKASDKQLEQFGLKPPKIELTVYVNAKDDKAKDDKDTKDKDKNKDKKDTDKDKKDKDKKEEKYVFSFGNLTGDRTSGNFAKTGKSDLVYVVSKEVITQLEADLLDKAIFTFDVDKVKGMKLTGWSKSTGEDDYSLDLERKTKQNWVVKNRKFNLEPATAEEFLTRLSDLRALKFVSLKGSPKAEQGLTAKDNKDLMVIQITFQDPKKEPLKLTIGKLSAEDKGYYAMSSNFKDQVFLVPEEDFKKMLEKPVYFAKVAP